MLEKQRACYTQVSGLHLDTGGTIAIKQDNSALKRRLQVDVYIRETELDKEQQFHSCYQDKILYIETMFENWSR